MSCDVGKASEGLEKSCDVDEVTEMLENDQSSLPTSRFILQPFRCFTYVTVHSPTLPLLHLRHSSFSNPSFASLTSQDFHLHHLASRPWYLVERHSNAINRSSPLQKPEVNKCSGIHKELFLASNKCRPVGCADEDQGQPDTVNFTTYYCQPLPRVFFLVRVHVDTDS